jgi:flagellar export protein FliJ
LGEYFQQHLQQGGKTGGHLRSHDKFVARIETALQAQSAEADKVREQIQQISQALLQIRIERMRYEALLTRLADQEAQALAKREQKTTDELSGRLAAARVLATRRQQGV